MQVYPLRGQDLIRAHPVEVTQYLGAGGYRLTFADQAEDGATVVDLDTEPALDLA